MNAGKIKFYLVILAILAVIFGAVAAAVSVPAGAATVGVLVGMFALFIVVGGIKTDSWLMKIILGCSVLLAIIFLGVAAVVSVRAAAIAVGILALLAAGFGVFIYRYFIRDIVQLGKSFESALSMEVRLEPKRRRHKRNREAVESLAAELTVLGFVPAGFFKLANQDVFVEGWSRPDLRLYAAITECGDIYAPFVEISAFYADGGSFCVSASEAPEMFERPANMIDLRLPGARPTELLNIMMQRRPQAPLLEAPPENFKTVVEEEADSLRDFVVSQADDDEDEDEDEFYETRAENGK